MRKGSATVNNVPWKYRRVSLAFLIELYLYNYTFIIVDVPSTTFTSKHRLLLISFLEVVVLPLPQTATKAPRLRLVLLGPAISGEPAVIASFIRLDRILI